MVIENSNIRIGLDEISDSRCIFCYPPKSRSTDFENLFIFADRMPVGDPHILISSRFHKVRNPDTGEKLDLLEEEIHGTVSNLFRIREEYPAEFYNITENLEMLVEELQKFYRKSRDGLDKLFIVEHGQMSKSMEHFHIHLIGSRTKKLINEALKEFGKKRYELLSGAFEDIYSQEIEDDYLVLIALRGDDIFGTLKKGVKKSQFFREWLGEKHGLDWDAKLEIDLLKPSNKARYCEQIQILKDFSEYLG